MKQSVKVFVLALIYWTSIACLQPSEERALRDLEVGKAQIAGSRVDVEGGLAAVRSLQEGELVLWASAPVFEVSLELDSQAKQAWAVEVHNGMPNGILEVRADGVPWQPSAVQRISPTRSRWEFDFSPPHQVKLHFSSPVPEGPLRIAVMSDVQKAINDVQDIFHRINEEEALAFLWTTGDLTINGRASQMDRFQRELEALSIPLYGTLGNHDIMDRSTRWHEWFGRSNVHFWYGGIAFSAVDSASGTLDPLVYDWLDGWLGEARDSTHLFATHIPILDPIGVRGGGFASRNEAGKLLKMLAHGHVDAAIHGHIHSYYAFESAGIPSWISGGGGAIPEQFDGIGRHFLVVDVDPKAGLMAVNRVDIDK